MSGRKVRNLVLLLIVAGVGYWIFKDRPTVSGIIDTLTNPLMGSRAAVKSSERNRVQGEAASTVAEQSESRIESLHEGMSRDDIKELLGEPDAIQTEKKDGVVRVLWTYRAARRLIVFQGNRVVSISVL
jgi:hypothetical protein